MANGVSDAEGEEADCAVFCGRGDEVEEWVCVPYLAVCEDEDLGGEALEAVLDGGLDGGEHFGAAEVGGYGVDVFLRELEGLGGVGAGRGPEGGVRAAEGNDIEVRPAGEGGEEEVQGGFDGGDFVPHGPGAVDDEDDFGADRGEGELRDQSHHEGGRVREGRVRGEEGARGAGVGGADGEAEVLVEAGEGRGAERQGRAGLLRGEVGRRGGGGGGGVGADVDRDRVGRGLDRPDGARHGCQDLDRDAGGLRPAGGGRLELRRHGAPVARPARLIQAAVGGQPAVPGRDGGRDDEAHAAGLEVLLELVGVLDNDGDEGAGGDAADAGGEDLGGALLEEGGLLAGGLGGGVDGPGLGPGPDGAADEARGDLRGEGGHRAALVEREGVPGLGDVRAVLAGGAPGGDGVAEDLREGVVRGEVDDLGAEAGGEDGEGGPGVLGGGVVDAGGEGALGGGVGGACHCGGGRWGGGGNPVELGGEGELLYLLAQLQLCGPGHSRVCITEALQRGGSSRGSSPGGEGGRGGRANDWWDPAETCFSAPQAPPAPDGRPLAAPACSCAPRSAPGRDARLRGSRLCGEPHARNPNPARRTAATAQPGADPHTTHLRRRPPPPPR